MGIECIKTVKDWVQKIIFWAVHNFFEASDVWFYINKFPGRLWVFADNFSSLWWMVRFSALFVCLAFAYYSTSPSLLGTQSFAHTNIQKNAHSFICICAHSGNTHGYLKSLQHMLMLRNGFAYNKVLSGISGFKVFTLNNLNNFSLNNVSLELLCMCIRRAQWWGGQKFSGKSIAEQHRGLPL